MFGRPGGAGLHGPALNALAPGLGRFARHPGDAVVRAARGAPLWANGDQARLHGLRVSQHQRPAGVHPHAVQRLGQLAQARGFEQSFGLLWWDGQNDFVKTCKNLLATAFGFGLQLPAVFHHGVGHELRHTGLQLHIAVFDQRRGPGFDQAIHAGRGHPVALSARQASLNHAAIGVEHAHGVGAPRFAHAGGGGNGQLKARVAHGEVLGPVVEAAKRAGAGGHASAQAPAFVEQGDVVAGLAQSAGASDAGHADTDDGDVWCVHGFTLAEKTPTNLTGWVIPDADSSQSAQTR